MISLKAFSKTRSLNPCDKCEGVFEYFLEPISGFGWEVRDTLDTSPALGRTTSCMDTTNQSHQDLHLRSVSSHRIAELWKIQQWEHEPGVGGPPPSVSSWNILQLKKLNSFRMFAAISLRNRCSRLYVQSPHWIIIVNSSTHLRFVVLYQRFYLYSSVSVRILTSFPL